MEGCTTHPDKYSNTDQYVWHSAVVPVQKKGKGLLLSVESSDGTYALAWNRIRIKNNSIYWLARSN